MIGALDWALLIYIDQLYWRLYNSIMTHYATLGVAENASPDEIKQAYRKLAGQHHPDKGGDTATFQRVQEAYSIIGNEGKRAQYDAERRGGGFRFTVNGQPFEHHFGGMDEIFTQFGFNPFGDPFGRTHPRRNKDLRIKIQVDLKDTLEEQTKTITVKTTNNDDVTVEVKIPRGVTTGTTVKYTGLGDNLFSTLSRGDLYIQFEVRQNSNYEVHGIDLLTNVSINSIEALVGCEKSVTSLDGKEFKVSIPSGTQPNSKLRLMGQGLWAMNQNIRGNLLININVVTPILTAEQMQLAKQLLNSFN